MAHIVFVDSRPYGFRAVTTARRMGHEITFIASEAFGASYTGNAAFDALAEEVDRVVRVENSCDPQELRKTLDRLVAEHPVDAVIALHDEVVQSLAPVARDMGLRYTSAEGVANARDKAHARELLAAAGLPGLAYEVIDSAHDIPGAVDRVGLPAVVKPASGSASVAATVVRTASDVELARRRVLDADAWLSAAQKQAFGSRLVVERYLEGPLLSVEIAVSDGVAVPFAVLERQRYAADESMELGSIAPARLTPDEDAAVRAYATDVVNALGLDFGIFHIEVIHTAQGPCLIDPNPRLIGGPAPLLIKECWGVDLHEQLVHVFLGHPVEQPPRAPRREGAAHILAPTADVTYAGDADLAFLDEDPRVRHWALRAEAGQRIRRATSNFHYIGHVLAVADTYLEAADVCISSVSELADRTGIPMIVWSPLSDDR
ncbi:ATP-grasp domain-containing protein [Streptomyces sp. NPDC058052]|uniref:ATP-grasp domain-containing protein n=1 Tax=Streptomyces sp. NPDC058052 TaxID=3346316 RepID=UPI0036E53CBE